MPILELMTFASELTWSLPAPPVTELVSTLGQLHTTRCSLQEDDGAKKKTKRKRTPAKPAGTPQPPPPATGPAMTGPADNRLVLGFNAAQRHLFMRVSLRRAVMATAGQCAMA